MAQDKPFPARGGMMTGRPHQNLETLLPLVLPLVLPCPTGMAMDALQRAAVDFCKKSEVWREVLQAPVIEGRYEFEMYPERGGVVLRVLRLVIDGWKADRQDFSVSASVVRLHSRPQRCATATVWAVIGPKRGGGFLPPELLDEWGDVIAAGATARLKAMTGSHIEWSDPQTVPYHQQIFDEGTARARIQTLRGERGGGSFFVRDMEGGL